MTLPAAIARRIRLMTGDITGLEVDAVVNAANSSLLGGGGVDGAIHRRAGPELLAECRGLGGCPPGEARLTRGYRLPAAHVIHTVGPVWQGGEANERQILEACYRACLDIARRHGFRDVALPAISTGVFGFPGREAAQIAVREVGAHLERHDLPETVIFVCFNAPTREFYDEALGQSGSA
ncbi:MAG: O-acetyl-ADP-ribose deacetylase [Alphaproteobacteria bacterium]|nr:O-acetyl-ADP-ribose deacetylase [Alphaproteobacteria bacterium]